MIKSFALSLILGLGLGFSQTGKLTFYRPKHFAGSLRAPTIKLVGAKGVIYKIKIKNGSIQSLELPEGIYLLFDRKEKPLTLEVKNQQTNYVYLHFSPDWESVILTEVTPNGAQQDFKRLKFKPKRVHL